MLRESRKALSLQALAKHQERIRSMVNRIGQYKPTFHRNANYNRQQIDKRLAERERQSDKLFEENLKLIYRLQTTGPKIETKKFPEVRLNPRRLKTLSISRSKTSSRPKVKILDTFRNEDQLFEENMKLITNIECTGPKIECWTARKARKLNDLAKLKKREEQRKILEKFKQISQEMSKLSHLRSFKRSSSISSLNNKTTL